MEMNSVWESGSPSRIGSGASPSPVLTRVRISLCSTLSWITLLASVGTTKCARSVMLFATEAKKNKAFCMCTGSPSPAFARKHIGNARLGWESRLGCPCESSSMHFDLAAMLSTCSSVGRMQMGE